MTRKTTLRSLVAQASVTERSRSDGGNDVRKGGSSSSSSEVLDGPAVGKSVPPSSGAAEYEALLFGLRFVT